MYATSSALIAALLFVSMAIAIELGYRVGLARKATANDAARAHVNAIQASIMGILALLLGFTFSLSLQRFDSRSEAVVDEANAIGTTWLRAQLLPSELRDEAGALLAHYVDLRVAENSIALSSRSERAALLAQAGEAQNALWAQARRAVAIDPGPATSGLYIQSLNETIDSFGRRNAALDRHVPELVLLVLYASFLLAGAILGFSCGIAGHRQSLATYLMVALIVVLVFIILDLDRPRRGLIEVSQQSLLELQATVHRNAPAAGASTR